MSQQITPWEAIIAQYKESGLSQPTFCKQNGLSWNQFQYRWYQHNLAKKTKVKLAISENSSPANLFEPISLAISSPVSKEDAPSLAELAIYLPNQIRCEIKLDLHTPALATLLKQLVTLC